VFSPLIESLIKDFRFLPGIGPKSAQRMVLYTLKKARTQGLRLAESLKKTIENVGSCRRCHTFSELPLCQICTDTGRDSRLLCVVETPSDMMTIEQTHAYKGYYFVLMDRLSPLEGIGPEELGVKNFLDHLAQYPAEEVILATSSTVEGETTAHYLSELLKSKTMTVSRLAYGIPLGNELEFIDYSTLIRALLDRKQYDKDRHK
jgi:recombination protein RecR